MPRVHRIQEIVLPILRAWPALSEAKVGSWTEDIDYRHFPMINVRRIGGTRNHNQPLLLSSPVIELTAYGTVDLEDTEDLYEDALEALYDAVQRQTVIPNLGSLSGITETMGATQFDSPFQASWRVQGLIRLGLRPIRTTNSH
jgi:hypothetical protein